MILLALVNAGIFFMLAALHFFWATGGRWGWEASIPSSSSGTKIFSPSPFSCIVVGIGLNFMGATHLGNAGIFSVSSVALKYGTIAIGIIFLARAIGDFKWIGLFKKIEDTPFGRNDSLYYVPLCLFLSSSAFIITYI